MEEFSDGSRSARRRAVLEPGTRSSLAVDASVDLGKLGLERSGSRAVARSGTLEWVDPFVGLRVRHELAPGKELQFLGDIGGFGVGSDLTWQLFAGYSFDFSVWQSSFTASSAIAPWRSITPRTAEPTKTTST